jgi:hypothetical protein
MKSTCPASDENLKSKNEKNLTGKRRETKIEERKYLTVKRRERERALLDNQRIMLVLV